MPINNSNLGPQTVGMQQANEGGSNVTSNPQINTGGGGGNPLPVPKDTNFGNWRGAHANIRPGSYRIVNQARRRQLVVTSQYGSSGRLLVHTTVFNTAEFTTSDRWEVRRNDNNNTWDLGLVSSFNQGYLHDGPHVYSIKNSVRLIPVPYTNNVYYISPNLGDPNVVILDISPNGATHHVPATSIQLRTINDNIHEAQWELIPI